MMLETQAVNDALGVHIPSDMMELGLWTHDPTPVVNAVLALVQARGRAAGLYTPVGTSR